jgi:hypothetical protein
VVALRPPLEEPRRQDFVGLRLARIGDPEQLEVGVLEEEAPARGALAGVGIRGAFVEPQPHEGSRLGRRADGAADEDVIDRCVHASLPWRP